jgi:hypothetical protein
MNLKQSEIGKIEARANELGIWLQSNAPECRIEQSHLQEGSQERAYWHYGYLVALRDTLRLVAAESMPSRRSCRQGSSNRSVRVG